MTLLRKFYDADVAEVGGTAIAEPSIAELMAKQGYNSDNRPEPPAEDKGNNEQVETKEEAQAATASAETKVETLVQEAEKPSEQVAAVAETVVEEKPQTTTTWQEVLKQQQPDTVLKELGFDDNKVGLFKTIKDLTPQMAGFLDTWKNNGDVVTYLKEMTTDYSKMSSEEVMRSQLRLDYPKATEAAINALFKKEVIEAYQLNPDKYSDEEVEEGRLLLDAKADKYRDTLVERQKQFLLPKAPEAVVAEQEDKSEQENAARFEAYKTQVSNDPYTKNIFTNKFLSIGEGDEKFNFPVEPTQITDILFDSEKWAETMCDVALDEKGNKTVTPKVERQVLVAAVAKYGKNFISALAQHFKDIGGKKVIEPIDNAKPINTEKASESVVKPTSPAQAMAMNGVLR